jgi:hypothetical protein
LGKSGFEVFLGVGTAHTNGGNTSSRGFYGVDAVGGMERDATGGVNVKEHGTRLDACLDWGGHGDLVGLDVPE